MSEARDSGNGGGFAAALARVDEMIARGALHEAEGPLNELLAGGLGDEDLVAVGEMLLRRGVHAAAVQVLGPLVVRRPEHHPAANLCGMALMAGGKLQDGLTMFQMAHQAAPGTFAYMANLGKALLMLERPEEARAWLESALAAPARPEELAEARRLLDGLAAPAPAPEPEPARPIVSQWPAEPQEHPRADPPPEGLGALADKKILLGPSEIAGTIRRMCKHLRRRGLDAMGVNYQYHLPHYDYSCDINLHIGRRPESEKAAVVKPFVEWALPRFDIFHFYYNRSLLPDLGDLKIIKDMGKKVLFSFCGSDARALEWNYYHQAKFLGHEPPKPFYLNHVNYAAIRKMMEYADCFLGLCCIPYGHWVPGLVDAEDWTLEEKQRLAAKRAVAKDPAKTYILHSRTDDGIKGSSVIGRLLDECARRGLPIEVISVRGLPLGKAKEVYAQADFALPSVGGPFFGLFGMEMMLWEIPVINYIDPYFDELRGKPPVVKITKQNFVDRMARCVEMKRSGEMAEMGRAAREWVLRREDINRFIGRYVDIYRELAETGRVRQLINSQWFAEEQRLLSGQKSDFYKFMIGNRVFEELGLAVPNYDRRLYN